MGIIEGGVVIEDGIPRSVNPFGKTRRVQAGTTIQSVINAASAGDVIYIDAGDYDEAVTITTDNLTLVGIGSRGAVAIAPSAANAKAITIDGTASRIEEVTLVNIGGEGNGTGGGLHVKANIRRLRFAGCKFEGGVFGAKLESTAAGSVGDVIFDDVEFAWTTTGLHLTASGGGDPVTNVQVRRSLFHNNTGRCILSDVAHTTDLTVSDCIFAGDEAAAAPTNEFVKVDVASTSGLFARNSFYLATMAVAKLAIAAGVLWVGNTTEAGVGGRPS